MSSKTKEDQCLFSADVSNYKELNEKYHQITQSLKDFNLKFDKIDKNIHKVYKKNQTEQLKVVQDNYKNLETQYSENEMNLKYQKQVITLQNELQFFKDESIRLNKIVKDYKLEFNTFKQKYESAFDDNKFLKEKYEIMSVKLKEMNEDYRNYQETLESLKDNNESNTFLTSNNISHNDINHYSHNRVDMSTVNIMNKQYKNVVNNNSYLDKTYNLSHIEDVKSSANNTINKNSSIMYNPQSRPESRGDGRPESAQHLSINKNQNANRNYFSNTLVMSKSNDNDNNNLNNIAKGKDDQIKSYNTNLKNQDKIKESKPKKKLVEDQIKLKDKLKKIELENKKIKSMRNLKTIENQEEIFLKCINDVKHELLKNPQMKLSKSNTQSKTDLNHQNISKATLNARPQTSKSNLSENEANVQKILENEVYTELELDANSTFEQFVNVDKAKLLNLILNNEYLSMKFQQILFPDNKQQIDGNVVNKLNIKLNSND